MIVARRHVRRGLELEVGVQLGARLGESRDHLGAVEHRRAHQRCALAAVRHLEVGFRRNLPVDGRDISRASREQQRMDLLDGALLFEIGNHVRLPVRDGTRQGAILVGAGIDHHRQRLD